MADEKTSGQRLQFKKRYPFLEHPNNRFGPSCFVKALSTEKHLCKCSGFLRTKKASKSRQNLLVGLMFT